MANVRTTSRCQASKHAVGGSNEYVDPVRCEDAVQSLVLCRVSEVQEMTAVCFGRNVLRIGFGQVVLIGSLYHAASKPFGVLAEYELTQWKFLV